MGDISTDVLVVGGGFAGRTACRALESSGLSVVLVDEKSYFEFTPSVLRAIAVPSSVFSIAKEHVDVGRNVSFLRGTVSRLSSTSATVETSISDVASCHASRLSQVHVRYKYCLWAGGSAYPAPIRSSPSGFSEIHSRETEFKSWLSLVQNATSILVLGGGLVGVELAAELARIRRLTTAKQADTTHFSSHASLKIALAAPGGRLIPRLPLRARRKVAAFFESNGVDVIKSKLVQSEKWSDGTSRRRYTAEDGCSHEVLADLVFDCTGPRAGASGDPLRRLVGSTGTGAGIVPGRAGFIRVRKTLQLPDFGNIFVAGDAGLVEGELESPEYGGLGCEKTAYAAVEAGRLAAYNIRTLSAAGKLGIVQDPRGLRKYPHDAFPGGLFPRLFAVSLGKWDGVLCLGPLVMGGPFCAFSKFLVQVASVRSVTAGGVVCAAWEFAESCVYRVVQVLSRVSYPVGLPSVDGERRAVERKHTVSNVTKR